MKYSIPKLMSNFSGSVTSKLQVLIDSLISKVHTTSIGIIESFDPETQTALIQPAIKRVMTSEKQFVTEYTTEPYPLLVNVPVVFSGGGDWFLTFPVKKGDECLIVSMERSIDNWKLNGGLQDPSNFTRKLSFKDAVAIVGVQSKASSLPSFNTAEPELRNRDGSIKLTMTDSGVNLIGDSDNAVRYSALEEAYNELNNKFNGLISVLEPIFAGVPFVPVLEPGNGAPSVLQAKIAAAWVASYGTFVPPVITLESSGDITPAKVDEILVP